MLQLHGPAIHFFVSVTLLIVGVLIEAVILQASCGLYNKVTGFFRPVVPPAGGQPETATGAGPEYDPLPGTEYLKLARSPGVPRPNIERAVLILFVTVLVNATATFILLRVRRLLGYGGPDAFRTLSVYLVVNPLGILVLGIVNTVMLPTTFVRGVLVALIAGFFGLLAAAALVAVYLLVVMALGPDAVPFG